MLTKLMFIKKASKAAPVTKTPAVTVARPQEHAPEVSGEKDRVAHKYLRKIVTKKGTIRYVYEETPEKSQTLSLGRKKKKDFGKKMVGLEDRYKNLFEEVCNEIEDTHYTALNAGATSVRFFDDTDLYLNFLNATEDQRNSPEVQASFGTYGIKSGKMAFNMKMLPPVPDVWVKLAFGHELGHSWFFGLLRMKDGQTFTEEEEENKEYVTMAMVFVNEFGQFSSERRKMLDENIGKSSQDEKQAELDAAVQTSFVSEYAAIDDVEEFAELFSYYHVAPEILKEKDNNMFELLNGFFAKYTG